MRSPFLLLFVAGCGGAPFLSADDPSSADAQSDARFSIVLPPPGNATPEAGDEATPSETSAANTVDAAPPVDSGPVCVTFPDGGAPYCHGSGGPLNIPQSYAIENGNCGAATTPAECQTPCTYTCACLAAHWAGCDVCHMAPTGLAVCGGT